MSNEHVLESTLEDTVDVQRSWERARTGGELGSFVARRVAILGDADQDISDLFAA